MGDAGSWPLGGVQRGVETVAQRLDDVDRTAPTNSCGPVALVELSAKYQVSATNLKRMFKKAETDGLLAWEQQRRRGALILSSRFIEDYFVWQSAKFVAIDRSYHLALAQLGKIENAAAA